jgi:hypothetical protein
MLIKKKNVEIYIENKSKFPLTWNAEPDSYNDLQGNVGFSHHLF